MKTKYKVGDKVVVDAYFGNFGQEYNVNAIITQAEADEEEDGENQYSIYTPHDDGHSAWYFESQIKMP